MKKKLIRITTIASTLSVLLKGQLEFINRHFEVIGVASGREELDAICIREGVRTVECSLEREIKIFRDITALCCLIRIFLHETPCIVHANTPKAGLLSMFAAWLVRVPNRIYTVTGLRFETTRGLFRLLLKNMERLTCFFATKVIPEGEGVKATLIREKITKKPLKKILNGNINGVDLNFYARTEEINTEAKQILKKIKREPDGFVFGFVGRLVRDKGITELIYAFERFYQENNKLRLILVGDFERKLDPLPSSVEKIIETHPGIFAAGYQTDVRPYYAAFDALVFPSYREGFPNVVLQAGAMGLPSIVTNISGCNEIIIESKNGIIIPPHDEGALYQAMKQFVKERETLLPGMISKARKLIADRYEQSAVWQATLEMYNGLLKNADVSL